MLFASMSWGWLIGPLTGLLILTSLFLMLLVLIQRGKGGGLAGAFGGAGGSSAFGSRAGDTFTKVTIIVAIVWILMVALLIKIVPQGQQSESAGVVLPAPAGDDSQ